MSRIPQDFIDDLLNRLDIVEVIDSRVKLKKTGKNYSACCPFHKEKTPSFTVSPDKQFYYCFGCGASGTALGFLMEFEHLSFIDAVENLAQSQGLSVPREQFRDSKPQRSNTLYTLLERAKAYYQAQLKEHPQRNGAVNYLKNRGLDGQIAKRFALGFAPPGWDNVLLKFGLSSEDRQQLEEAGLTVHKPDSGKTYDRFRHRIMFPIIDVRGRTIGFGGRILAGAGETQRSQGKDKGAGPKYLNSPETPVFYKGKELYGLYQALNANRRLEQLLVVEGYMDVIALAQYGIDNAVATLGTACGEDHFKLAFRYTSNIVFCFDGDNAGRKAAKRALENALPAMNDGKQITFLFLPEGQDPDTLVRQIGAERFAEQLKNALPLEEFFFEAVAENIDLRTMDGRARMSKIAAPLLNQLPQGVFRELMFDALAKRTGLSLDVLQELMVQQAPAALVPQAPAALMLQESTEGHSPQTKPRTPTEPTPHASAAEREIRSLESVELNASQKMRRTKLSPAKLATTILLENPALIQKSIDFNLPAIDANPDLAQLSKLINFLNERPQSSFHSILGYWAGQYGMAQQQQLTQLVADQFLGSARRSSVFDSELELSDALQRLRCEAAILGYDREIESLLNHASLDDSQKQRLRDLLKSKQEAKQRQKS